MKILILLVVCALREAAPAGEKARGREKGWVAKVYHFPFLCTVTSGEHDIFVSTGSIINDRFLIASSESMCVKWGPLKRPHYYKPTALRAWAGTMFMNPKLARITEDYRQGALEVAKIHFSPFGAWAEKIKEGTYGDVAIRTEDSGGNDLTDVFKWNIIGGMEIGVCIVELKSGWEFSSYVLPIPLFSGNNYDQLTKKSVELIDKLENFPLDQTACYISAWNRVNRTMDIKSVMYVPQRNCREMYCTFDNKACLEFPAKEYLVCFKSLTYIDLCPEDRGGAIYCPSFSNSTLAILTTSPNCGFKNLPNVYTLISVPMKMFDKVKGSTNFVPAQLTRYRIPPPNRPSTELPGFDDKDQK